MIQLKRNFILFLVFIAVFTFYLTAVSASEWPSWRGPFHNGVSPEKNLIANWSLDGENLIWKEPFKGRSTPIVMNGRVYVIGRTGKGITAQRVVACYDAEKGGVLWENRNNVFHTTVPFPRVGWASLAGDPETGNVYVLGVDGLFTCYDQDGKVVWEHSLVEEYFRFSGYGGRTNTPFVDEELVIISHNNNSWGEQMPMRPRFLGYDKKTGELVWVTSLKSPPKNTNYSNPVLALINGQRAMVTGAPDGAIYAIKVRTGEIIWKFSLSKGAIQTSVVVEGNRVYAAHGAENFESVSRGRVVCFNANGRGDITRSNEIWRVDDLMVGYASPVLHAGRLYVVTDAGNLVCLDAANGDKKWTFNLGTVGKGSPVWADNKIFATEVNGHFHIIEPGETSAKSLDKKQIVFDEKRYAEIYGSPAIAYGRIYFTTEEGLYCLGNKNAKFSIGKGPEIIIDEEKADEKALPSVIKIVPAEIWIKAGETIPFKVRAYDNRGRSLEPVKATFSLQKLPGRVNDDGVYATDRQMKSTAGYVVARVNSLESKARVQVMADLPFSEDFESFEVDKNPPLWPGAAKFVVKKIEGNQVLVKPPAARNLKRHNLFLGPPDMKNYTIQADLLGTKEKRRRPDMGLIANRYYLDLMGRHQRLQVRSWPAELRMMKQIDFTWQPFVWYTMKMRVDVIDGKAVIRGKVWPRDEKEPHAWSIIVEDPKPNTHGSPGLYGDSVTDIYFDNVKITRSK